jgi:hypothetical protein
VGQGSAPSKGGEGQVEKSYGSSSDWTSPAILIEAAARRASPLLRNLTAFSRSPQRGGKTRVSHMTMGGLAPTSRFMTNTRTVAWVD